MMSEVRFVHCKSNAIIAGAEISEATTGISRMCIRLATIVAHLIS